MHYSVDDEVDDDDDDDSGMQDDVQHFGDEKFIVRDAGLDVINGVYVRDGIVDGVGRYVKKVIVPADVQPGTNADIDFYSAPVSTHSDDYPPEQGWTRAREGIDPPPMVLIRDDAVIEDPHFTNLRG